MNRGSFCAQSEDQLYRTPLLYSVKIVCAQVRAGPVSSAPIYGDPSCREVAQLQQIFVVRKKSLRCEEVVDYETALVSTILILDSVVCIGAWANILEITLEKCFVTLQQFQQIELFSKPYAFPPPPYQLLHNFVCYIKVNGRTT